MKYAPMLVVLLMVVNAVAAVAGDAAPVAAIPGMGTVGELGAQASPWALIYLMFALNRMNEKIATLETNVSIIIGRTQAKSVGNDQL